MITRIQDNTKSRAAGARRKARRDAVSRGRSATGVIAVLASAAVLAGCSSAPPLEHVLLAPPQANQVPPEGSNWTVAQVKAPTYLDSRHIRYRASDFVIDELPNAKWAQRLPAGITALLQSTIDGKLEHNRDKPYTVYVTIATFAPQPSGQLVLSARWRVENRHTHKPITRNATVISKPLPAKERTPETIGRTMSRTVRELAYRIVAAAG